MSLYVFRDHDVYGRPSRLLDQHFGLGLDLADLMSPMTIVPDRHCLQSYYRPWKLNRQDSGSVVHKDKNNFQVNLDVQLFKPEEITVKAVDDSVVIEGKHEERQDEHGFISRQFVRRYAIPKEYDIANVASSLSSDGVLTITAPKLQSITNQERVIQITHTGEPMKAAKQEEKKEELPVEDK